MRSAGSPTTTPTTVAPSAASDRRDRERDGDCQSVGERAEQEPGDAGERQLRQRDLAGVAGDDHERQRDDREDEAGDQRGAPRAAGARRARRTPAGGAEHRRRRDRAAGAAPGRASCWMIAPRLGQRLGPDDQHERGSARSGTSSAQRPTCGSHVCWLLQVRRARTGACRWRARRAPPGSRAGTAEHRRRPAPAR